MDHSSREAWEQLCFKLTFFMNFIPVWVELPSNCTYFASDKTHQLSGFFDLLQVWTSWQMTQSFLVIKKYSLIQYFIPKVKAVHLPVLHKQNPLMLARWQYIVTEVFSSRKNSACLFCAKCGLSKVSEGVSLQRNFTVVARIAIHLVSAQA